LNNKPEIILKNLNSISSFLEKLYARLKVDVAGIGCKEIVINVGRALVLKKHIDRLSREDSRLTTEYYKYYRRLVRYVRAKLMVTKISIALTIGIAAYMIAYVILSILPQSPLAPYLHLLPLVVSTGGFAIVIIVITNILLWVTILRDYDAKKDYDIALNMWNRIRSIKRRLRILTKEYRRSEEYMRFFKNYNFCKCFEEFSKFKSLFQDFVSRINDIKSCSDRECLINNLIKIRDILSNMGSLGRICDTIHTSEYRVSIEFEPELINKLNRVIEDLRERNNILEESGGVIRLTIRHRTIEFDLLELIKTLYSG